MRLSLALSLLLLVACRSASTGSEARPEPSASGAATRRQVGTNPGGVGAGTPLAPQPGHQLAAFAAGCFWGVEDNFRQVPGVLATAVGYTGGKTERPSYEDVCSHTTGHAEAVLVEFDPAQVTYAQLLVVFLKNHDPTTVNRQGPDVGDQYRSDIFTFDAAQAEAARSAIAREEKELGSPIATRVDTLGAFWKAEEYHQQYDEKTGTHSCPIPKGVPRR
ncbi:MAG: peptide-methionine (S)-S-oxide reductase [Proteobacteria bacterium]|nr:MAG: peptide-methionine (S)-S-oxide reductase [Pseudomonadota bacterium]